MSEDNTQIKKIVEGAVLASSKPISYDRLMSVFEEGAQPSKAELKEAVKSLQEDYQDRGIELQEVASGLRFQVSEDVHSWVARLQEDRPARYSRALLETIAIIAYRQPLTRGDIEDVRGVAVSSNIVRTLMEREWVRIVGHRDVPGRPAMYATTRQFLDYFNLKNLDELPSLAEIKDLDQLNRELDLDDDMAQVLQEMVEKEAMDKLAEEGGEGEAPEQAGQPVDAEDSDAVEGSDGAEDSINAEDSAEAQETSDEYEAQYDAEASLEAAEMMEQEVNPADIN